MFLLGFTQPILYFIFETYGIKNASSSIAGVVISLIPITVALSSAFFLKEKPTVIQWVFIIISVLGVVMIVLFGQNGSGSVNAVGIVCLLFAVLSATSFSLLSRKLSTQFSPFELTYFMMGMGAITFTGICVVQQLIKGNWGAFFAPLGNSQFIVSLLYLGIISSIIAFSCINYALSKREASKTAIFANLTTIVSVIAGVLFLKEDFRFFQVIGSVLIIVGVWGTNTAKSKLPAISHRIPMSRKYADYTITQVNAVQITLLRCHGVFALQYIAHIPYLSHPLVSFRTERLPKRGVWPKRLLRFLRLPKYRTPSISDGQRKSPGLFSRTPLLRR